MNQAVVQNLDYLPFGDLNFTDSGITSHEFTGEEHDSESNLDHTWFRQYSSSSSGRWMTPDPLGMDAADPANPQSWNGYAYVLNNSVNLTDPLGLIQETPPGCKAIYPKPGGPAQVICPLPLPEPPPILFPPPVAPECGTILLPCPGQDLSDIWAQIKGLVGNPSGPQPPSRNPSYKSCISGFYNSWAGKATEFLSPVSLLPGWNPGAWKNIGHWAEAIGTKIAGTAIVLAGGNAGEIVNYSLTAGTATATVSELSGPVSTGLTALSKITPPAMATAAAYDALTHAGCAVQAQIGGPITPPIR